MGWDSLTVVAVVVVVVVVIVIRGGVVTKDIEKELSSKSSYIY